MMSEFRDFLQNFNVELVEQRATTNEGFIINAIFDIIMSSNIDTYILDTDGTHDTEVSAQDIQDHLKGENGDHKKEVCSMCVMCSMH